MIPYDPELNVDLSWMAGWPRSMTSFSAWADIHGPGGLEIVVGFHGAREGGLQVEDMHNAENNAAMKATAAAAQEPEAALCAAGSADAAALARPTDRIGKEAAAA